jgi:hypothetical protein
MIPRKKERNSNEFVDDAFLNKKKQKKNKENWMMV